MSVLGGPPLTSTLMLALRQSEALQRQLDDSTRTIDRVKRENEKLKQQLEELHQAQTRNDQPDLAAQLDHLFRKDAEKQSEIDALKKRLARANTQTQPPKTSSPVSGDDQMLSNASRKRGRISSREIGPLREIANHSSPGDRPRHKRRTLFLGDRGAESIAFIAEDGFDHNGVEGVVTNEEPAEPKGRLQALLSTAAATPNPLAATTPRPLSTKKTPSSTSRAPEDDEPLRSRPLHRLNLSHFKVNQKYSSGLPFAFQEVVRNKEARKCLSSCTKPECCGASFKALARTLPQDPEMSEDEMLFGFLGPGSEEKIRGLTPLARTNLVHEAKAKRLANLYGRMHRANFEAPSSPPDFWSVDIQGTQEHENNREQAKSKEREEVERRFQEAIKGGGRWLFADEWDDSTN